MTPTNALPTPKNRAFQRVSNGLPTRFQRGANCLAQRLPLLRKGGPTPALWGERGLDRSFSEVAGVG